MHTNNVALCLLFLSGSVSADIIYVDDSAQGTNDGTGWADAFTDLQSALAASQAGDQVWVAEGVYKPTNGTRRRTAFELADGIRYYGGFAGHETSIAERNWRKHRSILSGNLADEGKRLDNSIHIVRAVGLSDDVVFDGFTLTRAYNNHNEEEGRGGGMYVEGSNMVISNCVFRRNYAGGGGAIWFQDSTPTLVDCRFIGNKHRAVNNNNSHPMMRQCTFVRNSSLADGGATGTFNGSTLTCVACVFDRNSGRDGGAYFGVGQAAFYDCSFMENSCNEWGGAVYQFTQHVLLEPIPKLGSYG